MCCFSCREIVIEENKRPVRRLDLSADFGVELKRKVDNCQAERKVQNWAKRKKENTHENTHENKKIVYECVFACVFSCVFACFRACFIFFFYKFPALVFKAVCTQ